MNKLFYPILFEDETLADKLDKQAARIPRIEDQKTVTAKDGTVIDMVELREDMEAAKIAIVTDSPLFAPYVNSFIPIYTWYVDTMATDGVRLFVNPKFAFQLEWVQKIFVIIHEIMHCVLLHQERGQGYDHKLFNIAGDFEINAAIIDTIEGFSEDPKTKKVDPKVGEEFIKKLEGLYDPKYLGMPAEQIYDEVKKNPGKYKSPPKGNGGDPSQGKGKGGKGNPIEIAPGMKVRIKKTGEIGIVSKVNPDGTYEIDPLPKNESFYAKLFLLESYRRDEITPIMKGQSGGGGGGEPSGEDIEFEDDGQESDSDKDPLKKEADKCDVGRCGSILTKDLGEKIAEKSGYGDEPTEMGKGKDNGQIWRDAGKDILDRIDKQKYAGSGRGQGLARILGILHKGEVDWKRKLARFVGKALSPTKEAFLGNKKYLSNPDYVRWGSRTKHSALDKIIVMVDVSGSMYMHGDKTVKKILDEINGIIFSKKGKEVIVAFFDDGVDEKSVQTIKIKSTNPLWLPKDSEVPAGGGTSFKKALNWVKEKYHDKVALMIFATDGMPNDGMPDKPKYYRNFIWMVYDNPNFEQPFGQLISLFTEKDSKI